MRVRACFVMLCWIPSTQQFERGTNVQRPASSVQRRDFRLKSCAVAAGVLCCTSISLGTELSGVSVDVDGWTMVPLRDAAGVTHMIAARDEDELRMTDIDVVLYTRSAAGWDAEAYDPVVTKEDALLDIAAEFGLPDPMDGGWGIELDAEDVSGVAGTRAPFKTGFFTDDPLSEAADAMDNPQPLVEVAESLGLPSGGSLANTGNVGSQIDPQPSPLDGCGCTVINCLQDSIALGIDAMITDAAMSLEDGEAVAHDAMQAAFACCIPWTWSSWTGPWSAWACTSGWVNTGHADQSAGTTTCFYRRDVERSRMRTRVRRCFNCNIIAGHQNQRQTGEQETTQLVPRGSACPPTPASGPSCTSGPNVGTITSTGWTPPLPPC